MSQDIDAIQEQQKKALGILWRCFDFNKSELGRAANAAPSTVKRWFDRGRVSATAAIMLSEHPKVAGVLTKEEMRPDVKEWFGV